MNGNDEELIRSLRGAVRPTPDALLARDLWPRMNLRTRPVRPVWHIWDWAAIAAAIAVAIAFPEAFALFAYVL